ncbi:hypothetical protein NUW54_g11710 [Trametes sanguinea]|uniref:Uncharacterized protein n=1 Tax=Trametes sanguinea TaxID=158606 RepID=A0ACC1N8I3_9APHY|nr:hypothetical protein NUW54_g11710 [Trametes sanguinea]
MSVAVASSSNLQALEDASQPTSRASSPTSPTTSISFQPSQVPRVNVNVNGSHTNTPTSAYPGHALEPPPGVSYAEFLRSWSANSQGGGGGGIFFVFCATERCCGHTDPAAAAWEIK